VGSALDGLLKILFSFRLVKNARMQGAPAFAEAATRRQAKFLVEGRINASPTADGFFSTACCHLRKTDDAAHII